MSIWGSSVLLAVRAWFLAALCMTAFALYPDCARAQSAADQQALFQRMVKQPTNHEITFEFARVATARGDYEAAIGALERLLFYNPRLTQVKYELGALYFRLGSYEMAKRYFKEALASPDLAPETRARIEAYLPDASKQLQNSRFSGFAQTGIRTQTNANYAPVSGAILFNGTPLTLLPNAQKKSDVNWFGLAGLSHDYDLNVQRGDVLETRFVGYMTEQSRFSQLNVGLFDMSIGPRLSISEIWQGATIKPYVVGGNTWLDNKSYLSSIGAGLDVKLPVGNRFSFGPGFEWRNNDFNIGNINPVSPFNSGNSYTASLGGSWQATQNIRLDTRGFYRHGDAQYNFNAYEQWAAEVALTYEYAPPFSGIVRNWSVAPFFRLLDTKFGAPNPFIDPTTTQHDTMWSTGAIFNFPITGWFGISTAIQYDHTDSTIQNYRLNNFSVMVGPTARF